MRYHYSCKNCTHEQDVDKKLKDIDRAEICPHCHYVMRRDCGNAGGFRLKGSGWADEGYSTYYGDAMNFKAGYKVYKPGDTSRDR